MTMTEQQSMEIQAAVRLEVAAHAKVLKQELAVLITEGHNQCAGGLTEESVSTLIDKALTEAVGDPQPTEPPAWDDGVVRQAADDAVARIHAAANERAEQLAAPALLLPEDYTETKSSLLKMRLYLRGLADRFGVARMEE